MDKLPLIEVNGTNYEMGRQYGEECREAIHGFLQAMCAEVENNLGWSRDRSIQNALAYAGPIEEYAPDIYREIEGIADGSGLSLGEILIIQARGEFTQGITGGQECTSFAITAAETAEGELLIGQNKDLQEPFEEYGIMLRMTPKEGPRMLCCTLAGSLAHNGINSHGLGWAANAMDSGGWRIGVPRYILFRRVLEQESADAAIEEIRHCRRASSFNYLLAHASGAIADVEALVEGEGVLRPTDGLLAHSNSYLCPELTKHEKLGPRLPDSATRVERMGNLLNERKGSLSVETMMELLSDHHNYPRSICRHPLSDKEAEFANLKTIASSISRPASGLMHVAAGNPCQNEYHTYKL